MIQISSKFQYITTQNTLPNQNHINTDSNQDGTSTISTSDTNISPQPQTQQPSSRNYDPPSIPPQYSTQTLSHTSPQPGSSTHTNVQIYTHHQTKSNKTILPDQKFHFF